MSHNAEVLEAATAVAADLLAPHPIDEIAIESETLDPTGNRFWIVRAGARGDRIAFVAVRLLPGGTFAAERLR